MPLAYSLMQRSISVLAWRVNIRPAVKKRVDLFKISSTCGYVKRTLSKNSRLVDVCQFHFGKRRQVLVFITPYHFCCTQAPAMLLQLFAAVSDELSCIHACELLLRQRYRLPHIDSGTA